MKSKKLKNLNEQITRFERKHLSWRSHKCSSSRFYNDAAMRQYFLVTGRQPEQLLPKPVFSDFYVPSEDYYNRELAFITSSVIGLGALLWYY